MRSSRPLCKPVKHSYSFGPFELVEAIHPSMITSAQRETDRPTQFGNQQLDHLEERSQHGRCSSLLPDGQARFLSQFSTRSKPDHII